MFTVSCCWSFSFLPWSLCVWRSWPRTFCSMQKTIDGRRSFWTSDVNSFVSSLGNGQAFYRARHQHSMFIYTLFIISSLKRSRTTTRLFRSSCLPFSSRMYGMFQTVFYFGYMALFSLGLGIMCGTFGYIGTQAFVRKIYSIKID